ncbi:hypothetical protein GCM10022225_28720 [Plantactinospora mayteni]|uniref:Uncharacterized protein n=1 Tax=Plantactinospora mayteni TaxID=566021 RepID=A0ABQ4ETC3_9ACTN|nr:hypothetical protein [Plantactinospora mayteni]GIG97864.1 hypothetical protein Pma05_44370 [Plantactinospora mayteni]
MSRGWWRRWRDGRDVRVVDVVGPATSYPNQRGGYAPGAAPAETANATRVEASGPAPVGQPDRVNRVAWNLPTRFGGWPVFGDERRRCSRPGR